MEATSDQKGYADLKSEFGQMRADISAIMNFLGMPAQKRKSHNDMNRQGKVQTSLANTKNSKRTVKASIATSFPKRYVDEDDSDASDSDNQGQVEHAMFARVKIAPTPTGKLTVQSIYGQNSRTDSDLITSKSMWDDERIGYARPWPRSHEAGLTAASALYDTPNYWEEDKASSASSKNSLTTRTQHMEISMNDRQVKPLMNQ
jgi:hypothetical protein